ncbi:hypothetical protein [Halorubrum sp. Eb13]|uniref:hypothetical protein n=1 Tax=Halorubrum sp. Eb13 TaxID=1383843 RepID=UPI000BC80EA0|nr:hypothetical protein [Halorubrum sp. Eb13]OYR44157.1 hypothetical protein DJ75_10915 [Halorubrum sp. Eb13]
MSALDTRDPGRIATWSDLADREPTHAPARGHDSLTSFERRDLTTWKRDVADLTGVEYGGVGAAGRRR